MSSRAAAVLYDEDQYRSRRSRPSGSRSANIHELGDTTDDTETDDHITTAQLNVFLTHLHSKMNKETWKKLTPEDQAIWDTLSDAWLLV